MVELQIYHKAVRLDHIEITKIDTGVLRFIMAPWVKDLKTFQLLAEQLAPILIRAQKA